MEYLYLVVGAAAPIVVFFAVWNISKKRVAQAQESAKVLAESQAKIIQTRLESELAHANEKIDQLQRSLDLVKAESADAVDAVKRECKAHYDEALAAKEAAFHDAAAAAQKAHSDAMEALQKRFDETVEKVSAQLKSETGEMLKARQKEFSESSNISIGQIVNPLKENIAELKKTMQEGNKEQAERNGEIKERIKSLLEHSDAARKSADELAAALRHGSKVQGDWGETVLDELLSSQGLTRGIHYDIQCEIKDANGNAVKADGARMRPDVILHLDQRREVIIDSKVSITSYVEYVNAENEQERQNALKAHIVSVKKHVDELSKKDYSSYIQSPKVSAGYVIMFVPNIGALWTALNAEPGLWRWAADKNVYITDEQSLYGALKIVSMTWTQVAQAQNHEKVYQLANEMIDRVGLFMEKYEGIGKALKKAADEYDEGKKKLEDKGQSIITTSRKLIKLGAKNSEKHPLPALPQEDGGGLLL